MRLVYVALGWVAGILIAASFPTIIPLIWLILMGLLGGIAHYVRYTPYFWFIAALFALAAGGFRYVFVPQTSDLAQYNAVGGATIEGIVISEPDIRDDRVQLRLSAETIQFGGEVIPTSGLVLVNAPQLSDVFYGDRISITGQLSTPAVYDTFSYADYLARQGIFTLMDNTVIEIINHDEGFYPLAQLLRFKAHLQTLIGDALPDPEAALLTGILLGNERGIDPKLAEDFTRVGASHVIAISGFNMAIIAGLVMNTLERIFKERQWIAALLGIIVLAVYTLLVGANAAVVRAAIMSSLLFIAPKLNRRTYVPASLAFVVILMSIHNPLVLWDLSFQLSFFAVLGIALFSDHLEIQFKRILEGILPRPLAMPIGRFMNEPIVVSVAALIMTLPLIIIYFGRISLVSLLVNLLIVPLQGWLLILGGIALIVALGFPAIAQILFWLDMLLLRWTITVVRYFGDLPFADVDFSLPAWVVWVLFLCIIGGAMVNATRPKWAMRMIKFIQNDPVLPTLGTVAIGLILLMGNIILSRPDGKLHLWFLDVGHSNAILAQTPGGSQILIDGGRFPSRLLTSIGDRVPFYDREIELVVITHPDEFDVGALPAVLRRYDAGTVMINGHLNIGDSYQVIEEAIAPFDVIAVTAGYTVDMGDGAILEVLHPQVMPELGDSLGDHVLVLRISYEDVSFLLTSDLSQEGQLTLLEANQYPLATVMQMPQHGTARSLSTTFFEAAQPQVIVLQYEAHNRRGDPDDEIITLLNDEIILETGEQGTLHLWTDGRTLSYINRE